MGQCRLERLEAGRLAQTLEIILEILKHEKE